MILWPENNQTTLVFCCKALVGRHSKFISVLGLCFAIQHLIRLPLSSNVSIRWHFFLPVNVSISPPAHLDLWLWVITFLYIIFTDFLFLAIPVHAVPWYYFQAMSQCEGWCKTEKRILKKRLELEHKKNTDCQSITGCHTLTAVLRWQDPTHEFCLRRTDWRYSLE